MRKLQLVYCLEPAGSHGVWGLDDYHFLLFIFGSSQLIDHKYMKPKSIHNHDILDNFSNEFMYLSCIAFIKKVKELFAEHSPLLDDISAVPNWNKVNCGLLKCFVNKVSIMFWCTHFIRPDFPSFQQKLIKSQTLADNIKYLCSGFFGPYKQNKIWGFDDASVLMEYMQWQENCIQEGSHLTENRYEGRNLLD
ncbi:hypothetical protein Dsin_017215 [Dipteronia sinensis]|uniref:Serine/threonine-protein phosphatase 2A activator n=1 Tax=Dipteronia sinensis TaxID=43782 RepID=A0AAE0E6B9_9ROSI|nr:hypothetical protein Dsin_017215 [Dipteronia sinensis]